MESAPRSADPAKTPAEWPPQWLEPLLLTDARFARAYEALGDQRRARLKRVIAAQYALHPPRPALHAQNRELLTCGLAHEHARAARPFVLLLCEAGLDAPALFLAALLPVLTARPEEVLVARLGSRAEVPDSLLAACELAGQERLAALGPRQMERLLREAAASGLPGLVVHQDSPAFRRIFAASAVRAALDVSPLALCPLRPPLRPGVWRDAPGQLLPECVEPFYGALPFETGDSLGVDLEAFAAGRGLLLLPDSQAGRAGSCGAACAVCESQLGLYRWPELSADLLSLTSGAFSAAP